MTFKFCANGDDRNDKILRRLPNKKWTKTYSCPRFTKEDYKKFDEMNTEETREKYEKYKRGINYKTNKKMKTDGPIQKVYRESFRIRGNIMFYDLIDIDREAYDKETEQIIKENEKYNNDVDELKKKLDELTTDEEYIEFDKKFYGRTISNCIFNNPVVGTVLTCVSDSGCQNIICKKFPTSLCKIEI